VNHSRWQKYRQYKYFGTGWSLRGSLGRYGSARHGQAACRVGAGEGRAARGCDGQTRPTASRLGGQNRPNPPTGFQGAQRVRTFRDIIIAALERVCRTSGSGRTCERRLRRGYDSVKRTRASGPGEPLAVPPDGVRAGAESGDFGTAPVIIRTGTVAGRGETRRRRTHVFRMSESFRKATARWSTARRRRIHRCLENAFWHFGGVPRRWL